MSKLSEALERIEELEEQLELLEPFAVERRKARIVANWIEYSGLRVGLDAAGDAVRVELEPALNGWIVESE